MAAGQGELTREESDVANGSVGSTHSWRFGCGRFSHSDVAISTPGLERHGHGHRDGCQENHLKIVAGGCMGALRRQDPGAWHAAKRGDQRKDPQRHGTDPKEVADHVFRQARDEVDDEAEDRALGLDDEPHFIPGLLADQGANVVGAEPAAYAEGGHRAHGQPERRVDKSQPLAEEIAAEDARDVPGDGGDDDLQGLERDEDDGGQDPPLAKRLLEEALLTVETNQESVRRGVSEDEPDAVTDDDSGDDSPDGAPAAPADQLTPPIVG